MLFVTLDFEIDLRRNALVESNAYVSAVAENELDRNKQHAPTNKFIFDDPPHYQTQETNGRLEKPIVRITLKIDSGDITFSSYFVVMNKTNRANQWDALHETQQCTHSPDEAAFAVLVWRGKSEALIVRKKNKIRTCLQRWQPDNSRDDNKKTNAFVDQAWEWKTKGIVTPLEKLTETATSMISHSMATIIDEKVTVRKTNTTESPHTTRKNTQIAEFSVVIVK